MCIFNKVSDPLCKNNNMDQFQRSDDQIKEVIGVLLFHLFVGKFKKRMIDANIEILILQYIIW